MYNFFENLELKLKNSGFYNIKETFLYCKEQGLNLYVIAVINDKNKNYNKIIDVVYQNLTNFYKNTNYNKIYLLNLIVKDEFKEDDIKIFDNSLDFDKEILQVFWGYSLKDNKLIINKTQPNNFFGVEKILKNINNYNIKPKDEIEFLPKGKPYLTYTLICIMILVHLIKIIYPYINASFSPDKLTLDFGIHKGMIYNNEYYRAVTYFFIHGSFNHLLSNIIGLIIFGDIIEKYFGKISFLIIFFIGGIFAGLFSILFNSTYAIGASGAIFALEGATLYFTYKERKTLNDINFPIILVISIVGISYGFTQQNVDNAGHIGGFIIGIVMGIIYHYLWIKKYN